MSILICKLFSFFKLIKSLIKNSCITSFPKVHLLFFCESFRLIITSFQSIGIKFFPKSAFSLFYEFPNESKMFFIWNQQFWISANLIIIYGLCMIRCRNFPLPPSIMPVKERQKKKRLNFWNLVKRENWMSKFFKL